MRTGQNGDAEGLIIGLVSPKTKASTDPVPARPVQSRRGSRPNARRPGHSTARAFMSTPRPSATLDRPHTPSTGPLSLPVFFGAPLVAACAKIRAAPVWQEDYCESSSHPSFMAATLRCRRAFLLPPRPGLRVLINYRSCPSLALLPALLVAWTVHDRQRVARRRINRSGDVTGLGHPSIRGYCSSHEI